MIFNSSSKGNQSESVVISAMHRLPCLIILFGLLLLLLIPNNFWPGIIIASFGFFLLLQSFTLKLKFTSKELIVLQLGKELRKFPFKSWIAWRIFLPKLPGIFYFREEASPHLLPILFSPEELEKELKARVGSLEIKTD